MISWPQGHGAPAYLVTVRTRDSQVNRFGAKPKTVSLPALNYAGGRIGALCHASMSHPHMSWGVKHGPKRKLEPTAGDHWVVDLAAEKGAEYVPVHRWRTGSAG